MAIRSSLHIATAVLISYLALVNAVTPPTPTSAAASAPANNKISVSWVGNPVFQIDMTDANDVKDLVSNAAFTARDGYPASCSTDQTPAGQCPVCNFQGYQTYTAAVADTQLPVGKNPRTACAWLRETTYRNDPQQYPFGYGTPIQGQMFAFGRNGVHSLKQAGWDSDYAVAYAATPDTWLHICSVFDGSTAQLYANGVKVLDQATNWETAANGEVHFGSLLYSGQYSFLWTGDISELAVWDSAMNAAQVASIFSRTTCLGTTYPAATSAITSYNVYRSVAAGGPYTQVGSSTSSPYVDTTVCANQYYYVVRAAISTDESANSNEASATGTGPCFTIAPILSFSAGVCHGAQVTPLLAGAHQLQFSATGPQGLCTFYSSAECAPGTEITTVSATGAYNFYLKCTETYYQKIALLPTSLGVVSNPFQVVGFGKTGDAAVCGDPHFVGFDGQVFDFMGDIGSYYSFFSSPFVSINTLMTDAHNANPYLNATVNGAVGIRTHEYNISVDVLAYDDHTKTLTYEVNGKPHTIKEGKRELLGDCVEIVLTKDTKAKHHHHTLSIVNAFFSLYVYLSKDHNKYISANYLDYAVDVDLSLPETLGGILGMTAGKAYDGYWDIAAKPELFAVDGMFGLNSDDKYASKPVCLHKRNELGGNQPPQHVCQTLPNGRRCLLDANCGGGFCDARGVCAPPGSCLTNADCGALSSCVNAVCAASI